MLLKPWYDVTTPCQYLFTNVAADMLEFAIHLDKVKDGQALEDYSDPQIFFTRSYLTPGIVNLAAEVTRHLAGESSASHAVFLVSASLGSGKSHALTALYHLACHGNAAHAWPGVQKILDAAKIPTIPQAKTAVFVGTEFDSLKGRGGKYGEPIRKTPWGEIAFQLGGEAGFEKVAKYDQELITPDGRLIYEFLPQYEPCLILIDGLMNYLSRYREQGMAIQLYNFLQHFTEQVRRLENIVLVVTIPAKTFDMDATERKDVEWYRKMLGQFGQTVTISAEENSAQILRRRLFDWDDDEISSDGSIVLPDDALETCHKYTEWLYQHRSDLPEWFPGDDAHVLFTAAYPFHPMFLSMFERKWKKLPQFQGIRGILRLMALLLSHACREDFTHVYSDPLIQVGSAPLIDPEFRQAVLAQLGGNDRLEAVITSDICGKRAFAERLDSDASDDIKHNHLHVKAATAIFFESNGGTGHAEVTENEIRLAIGEPDLHLHNVDIVLEDLVNLCHFLLRDDKRYRFTLKPNLNKVFSDRYPKLETERIIELSKQTIREVFADCDCVNLFPEKSGDIPDQAALTLAILSPDYSRQDPQTHHFIQLITNQCGDVPRRFQNAIIWLVPDDSSRFFQEARTLLTWQDIYEELQSARGRELLAHPEMTYPRMVDLVAQHIERFQHRLRQSVGQTYKYLALLNKKQAIDFIDLGQFDSGETVSLTEQIFAQLRLYDYVADTVSPRLLIRNWPEQRRGKMWSVQAIREAFFVSPMFPRILTFETLKETIAKGVMNGVFAYVGPKDNEKYEPFHYKKFLSASDVKISSDRFLITDDMAEEYEANRERILTSLTVDPPKVDVYAGEKLVFTVRALDQDGEEIKRDVRWEATGGTINKDGVFIAGNRGSGDFEVKAKSGGKTAWGKVTVLSKSEEPVIPPPVQPPEPEPPKHLSWTGEVPLEKWDVFRKTVLAQIPEEYSLSIDIHLNVHREVGITEDFLEQLRSALQGMGLEAGLREQDHPAQ